MRLERTDAINDLGYHFEQKQEQHHLASDKECFGELTSSLVEKEEGRQRVGI
jgi:hypothetical protein